MFSKLGFPLLLLAFGLLAWASGVLMPDELLRQLPLPPSIRAWMPERPAAPGTKAAGKQASPATEAPAADRPKDPPLLESLLIPTPAPPQGRYSLQLGIFPGQREAESLTARVNGLHLPGLSAKTFQTRGRDGQDWWLVAAGDQAAPADLEMFRMWLGERLALPAVRPILLPPEAKKS